MYGRLSHVNNVTVFKWEALKEKLMLFTAMNCVPTNDSLDHTGWYLTSSSVFSFLCCNDSFFISVSVIMRPIYNIGHKSPHNSNRCK
jgi:hypothetical protein